MTISLGITCPCLKINFSTFLSMMTPKAVWAVKKMALIIMITPTGTLVFRAARLTIQPLPKRGRDRWTQEHVDLDANNPPVVYLDKNNQHELIKFLELHTRDALRQTSVMAKPLYVQSWSFFTSHRIIRTVPRYIKQWLSLQDRACNCKHPFLHTWGAREKNLFQWFLAQMKINKSVNICWIIM